MLDGKVLRASYNTSVDERFVHASAIKVSEDGTRERFIIGWRPTELDRKGEWGAALSILEGLVPLEPSVSILLSGDAGLCVELFSSWLKFQSGMYYLFRVKANAGAIYDRVVELATGARERNPEGDYFEPAMMSGSEIVSRRLWRIGSLKHSSYPGITEGFVIEKRKVEVPDEYDLQYFVTSYPREFWVCRDILDRILLHWDTETGVFGVKDRTFREDSVRYKSLEGAMGHVSCVNIVWNCLYAPIFNSFWRKDAPLSNRIQFCKDKPEFVPLL